MTVLLIIALVLILLPAILTILGHVALELLTIFSNIVDFIVRK